jgi:hypothetical protein
VLGRQIAECPAGRYLTDPQLQHCQHSTKIIGNWTVEGSYHGSACGAGRLADQEPAALRGSQMTMSRPLS